MKSIGRCVILVLVLFVFVLSTEAFATNHAGAITADQDWYSGGNPHIITSTVQVKNDATLTIHSGCVVKISPGQDLIVGSAWNGGGTLEAYDSTFTSTVSSPGVNDYWKSIWLLANSSYNIIDNCTVEYGGASVLRPGMITIVNAAEPTVIVDSRIRYSQRNGVHISSSAEGYIGYSEIYGNADYGVWVKIGSTGYLTENTVYDNTIGIKVGDSVGYINGGDVYTNSDAGVESINGATTYLDGVEILYNNIGIRIDDADLISNYDPSVVCWNDTEGIYITNGGDLTSYGLAVYHNQYNGVLLDEGSTASFTYYNAIHDNGNYDYNLYGAGLRLEDGSAVSMDSGMIYENHRLGVYVIEGDLDIANTEIIENSQNGYYYNPGVPSGWFQADVYLVDCVNDCTLSPYNEFDNPWNYFIVNVSSDDVDATYNFWDESPPVYADIEKRIFHNGDSEAPFGAGAWGTVTYSNAW